MNKALKMNIVSVMMAVLIGVGAYISFPLAPNVPFSMQIFIVFLVTFTLPFRNSMIAILLYLLIGSMGIPVFAGGTSGLGILFGKTGGFLIGFLLLPVFYKIFKNKILGMGIGFVLFYLLGIFWLSVVLNLSFIKCFSFVMLFIPLDIIKLMAAFFIGKKLKKINILKV